MTITTYPEVFQYAESRNISDIYALTLFGQSKHETANFTSNIYKNAINCFGMRPAGTRTQNRIAVMQSGSGSYAVFATVYDSWDDRIALDYYNKTAPPLNLEDVPRYCQEVKNKKYATDTQYVPKWLNVLKDVFSGAGADENQTEFLKSPMMKFGIIGIVIVAILGFLIASKKIKLPFKIPFIG